MKPCRTKIRKIGSFKIKNGEAIVSDPCYSKKNFLSLWMKNVKNGTWKAMIVEDDGYNAVLVCQHSKEEPITSPFKIYDTWEIADVVIGVDSGQVGVFDPEFYKDDKSVENVKRIGESDPICEEDPFYSICCDRTLNSKHGGVIPYGALSSSGCGDGTYDCWYKKDGDGVVVGIAVDFDIIECKNRH